MKTLLFSLLCCAVASAALANTAPTPVVVSAAMRPGTTFMDVVYRVNDPDDATVKVRALAFVDGVRSFANVLRPVTFVEGTAANIGDAITTNANHTLTWNVGADWNIALGQVKFEILCRDGRGLLAFDWISIPAAAGQLALTISKDTPSAASALSAIFWQYAAGDAGLTLTNGLLTGSASSGNFAAVPLVSGASVQTYGVPYLFKQMNLDPVFSSDVNYAAGTARAGILNTASWHAANRNYAGLQVLVSWGGDGSVIPAGLSGVTAIAAGANYNSMLKNDGTVVGSASGALTGITGITAVAGGNQHTLVLKNDGTVVASGRNSEGQCDVPVGLTGVTAIAAGYYHSLALKNDGTVVAWSFNTFGMDQVPAGLTGVTAISAGYQHSLALKNDGTVVNFSGSSVISGPAGLTGVIAIAAGGFGGTFDGSGMHSVALKNDGTVVAWGDNNYGQTNVPAGLTGVIAIAAGNSHSLALKSDGTIVAWGDSRQGQTNVPIGLIGVSAIAAGGTHSLALKPKVP